MTSDAVKEETDIDNNDVAGVYDDDVAVGVDEDGDVTDDVMTHRTDDVSVLKSDGNIDNANGIDGGTFVRPKDMSHESVIAVNISKKCSSPDTAAFTSNHRFSVVTSSPSHRMSTGERSLISKDPDRPTNVESSDVDDGRASPDIDVESEQQSTDQENNNHQKVSVSFLQKSSRDFDNPASSNTTAISSSGGVKSGSGDTEAFMKPFPSSPTLFSSPISSSSSSTSSSLAHLPLSFGSAMFPGSLHRSLSTGAVLPGTTHAVLPAPGNIYSQLLEFHRNLRCGPTASAAAASLLPTPYAL